jgi:peroxiredoxin
MRRSIAFLLAAGATLAFLLPPLQAQTSSGQAECPSCDSFGIQRFSEKKEAPFFNLKRVDGTFVNLRDLKGKPALLFFWATWCPSCKEEIGLFEKFLKGKTAQLSIFTLVIDGESEKAVQKAIQRHTIGLPVLLDVKEKIARTYGVKMVPSTYLISREGLMLGAIVGQRDWSSPEAWSAIRELFVLR